MNRRAAVVLIAMLATLCSAAFAHSAAGATIQYDAGKQRVRYLASTGESNNLTISQVGANYVFTDAPAVVITSSDGLASACAVDPISRNVARCAASAVRRIAVDGADRDDVVTMQVAPVGGTVIGGGTGYDILRGGPGSDRIYGGPGGDRITGRLGDDVVDTGHGGLDPNAPACVEGFIDPPLCRDEIERWDGKDTLSYASRNYPVYVDARVQSQAVFAGFAIDDPSPACISDPNGFFNPDCEVDLVGGISHDSAVVGIVGGSGADTLIGNKFANSLVGGAGADVLCGDLGVDTVDYSSETRDVDVSLDGSLPTDPRVVSGGEGELARQDCRGVTEQNDPIPPGPDAPRDCVPNDGPRGEQDCVGEDVENIIGGSGNDTLTGNSPDAYYLEAPVVEPLGANMLVGGPGNDTLNGKYGPDVLIGGTGTDTVTYADRTSDEPVKATTGSGNEGSDIDRAKGLTGDFNPRNGKMDGIGADIENIIGGAGNDTLAGDGGANILTGGGGDDNIDGKEGDDTTLGGAGDDSVRGGEGDDLLAGDSGDDVLAGDGGNDALDGGEGGDLLAGGAGADSLNGNEGTDTADWSSSTSSVSVSINGVNDDGTEGEHDTVGADVEGANGGQANDRLVLGAGDGSIAGGPGNDYLDGGPGADSIEGNAGLDEVDYSSRTSALSVDVNSPGGDGEAGENDYVHPDVETLRGGPANDMLVGGGLASVLIGNAGDDQLFGMGGDDQLFGGPGQDGLEGGNDNDTLDGGDDADNLFGSSGSDTLQGGGANDGLDGGPGRDSLSGGGGTDTASYAARTKALNLSFDGNSNDGESGEGDVIKFDVESLTAGAAGDIVNSLNGVKNSVTCGPGTDRIAADTFDEIAADCERIVNSSPCKSSPDQAEMSKSGVVTVRVSCTADASGSLQLRTAGKVKTSGQTKRLVLGSKSFKLSRGKNTKVKVRISAAGRRFIKRSKKAITAKATLTVRQSFGVRSLSLKNGDTLKIKAKG